MSGVVSRVAAFDRKFWFLRVLVWRKGFGNTGMPYFGSVYGKGLCFWWGRLWLEV